MHRQFSLIEHPAYAILKTLCPFLIPHTPYPDLDTNGISCESYLFKARSLLGYILGKFAVENGVLAANILQSIQAGKPVLNSVAQQIDGSDDTEDNDYSSRESDDESSKDDDDDTSSLMTK